MSKFLLAPCAAAVIGCSPAPTEQDYIVEGGLTAVSEAIDGTAYALLDGGDVWSFGINAPRKVIVTDESRTVPRILQNRKLIFIYDAVSGRCDLYPKDKVSKSLKPQTISDRKFELRLQPRLFYFSLSEHVFAAGSGGASPRTVVVDLETMRTFDYDDAFSPIVDGKDVYFTRESGSVMQFSQFGKPLSKTTWTGVTKASTPEGLLLQWTDKLELAQPDKVTRILSMRPAEVRAKDGAVWAVAGPGSIYRFADGKLLSLKLPQEMDRSTMLLPVDKDSCIVWQQSLPDSTVGDQLWIVRTVGNTLGMDKWISASGAYFGLSVIIGKSLCLATEDGMRQLSLPEK